MGRSSLSTRCDCMPSCCHVQTMNPGGSMHCRQAQQTAGPSRTLHNEHRDAEGVQLGRALYHKVTLSPRLHIRAQPALWASSLQSCSGEGGFTFLQSARTTRDQKISCSSSSSQPLRCSESQYWHQKHEANLPSPCIQKLTWYCGSAAPIRQSAAAIA